MTDNNAEGISTVDAAGIRTYSMLINGQWSQAAKRGLFDSVNPATGAVWSRVPEATAEDVDGAVRAAHAALYNGPWGRMTATERGHCLRRLGDLLVVHSQTLGEVETTDTGKVLKETRWQAKYIAEYLHFYGRCRRQGFR